MTAILRARFPRPEVKGSVRATEHAFHNPWMPKCDHVWREGVVIRAAGGSYTSTWCKKCKTTKHADAMHEENRVRVRLNLSDWIEKRKREGRSY